MMKSKIGFLVIFLMVFGVTSNVFAEDKVYAPKTNFGPSQGSAAAPREPKYKRFVPNSSNIGGLTAPNNFADRHAWRSGIAGSVAMWRQLIVNALPSDEPFPSVKKGTHPHQPKK